MTHAPGARVRARASSSPEPSAPPRRRPWRTASHALVLGVGIGLFVAAAGQVIALTLFLAQGAKGSYVPYLRVGALYVELFHHVGVEARAQLVGQDTALSIVVGIGLLLVLAVAVVLLWGSGRRIATATQGSATATVPALATGYAIVPFVLAFIADSDVASPGAIADAASLEIRVTAWSALVVPFAIASAAGSIGALSARRERASGASGDRLVSDVVAGGVRAFALAVVLSAAGVLVLASVQPAILDAYVAAIRAPDSARGRIIAGAHAALLLPNQAMWVLVPAMGACDEIAVDGQRTPFLCYWRVPTDLSVALRDGSTPLSVSPAFRPPPRGYLAFLLVPIAATVAGGVRGARGTGSMRTAALAGAASGLVFAGLLAAGIGLARIELQATGSLLGASAVTVEMGPEVVRGTLMAIAWGLAGASLGGAVSRYIARRGAIGE